MLTRHIQESLQVTPGPFPDFWVGPGDEARNVKPSLPGNPLKLASLTGLSQVNHNIKKKKELKKERIINSVHPPPPPPPIQK